MIDYIKAKEIPNKQMNKNKVEISMLSWADFEGKFFKIKKILECLKIKSKTNDIDDESFISNVYVILFC